MVTIGSIGVVVGSIGVVVGAIDVVVGAIGVVVGAIDVVEGWPFVCGMHKEFPEKIDEHGVTLCANCGALGLLIQVLLDHWQYLPTLGVLHISSWDIIEQINLAFSH